MFLFLRLTLAHLVSDFIFQTEEVFEIRKKGVYGNFLHSLIVFLTLLLFSFPYLKFIEVWIVIFIASLTHFFQDEWKTKITKKYPSWSFFAFIIDQFLHIFFLSPILIFDFSHFPLLPSENLPLSLYNNDSLIIFSIGYTISTFAGGYLWENFLLSYFKKTYSQQDILFLRKYGIFERFVITTSFLSFNFLCFLFVPLLFRIFSKRLKFDAEILFNLLFCCLIGIFLRRFLPIL